MLFPYENRYREVKELGGFWRFRADYEECGQRDGWFRGLSAAIELAVPASWNDQTQDERLRTHLGSVWYEKKFWIPSAWAGDDTVLRFGAVNYRAEVWLNGVYLGKHEGGFTPFEFNITDRISTDSENVLVVRADCLLSGDTVPMGNFPLELGGTNYYGQYPLTAGDFFPYAGINRPVHLYTRPRLSIQDISVSTSLAAAAGRVRCNIQASDGITNIAVSLLDQQGMRVANETTRCSNGRAEVILNVPNALAWGPGHPYLYNLRVEGIAGINKCDEYTLPIGFREVRVQGDQLLLNGEPIYLKGFGRHEDFHIIGRGMNHAVIVKDFSIMQWIGANSFRTTHYPYSDEQMQMADRLGFLVIDEVPAVSLAMRAVTEKTLESHKAQISEMIARDKNHPCVIAWSVANEADTWRNPADKYFHEVAQYIRALDDTRPNMIVLYSDPNEEKAAQYFDLLGVNRYLGWYQFPGQLEKAAEELDTQLDRFHERFKKPIILTEFGADAVAGHHSEPAEMYTEEYQSALLQTYHGVLRSKPYIVGEHIWNLADFKTQQHIRRVFYNHKGLFTRDRQPKMAAHTVKKLWQE